MKMQVLLLLFWYLDCVLQKYVGLVIWPQGIDQLRDNIQKQPFLTAQGQMEFSCFCSDDFVKLQLKYNYPK